MSALLATCDVCARAVTTGTGYLWIDLDLAVAAERANAAWNEAHREAFTVTELMTSPGPATWQVHHQACDPDPDSQAYCIDIEQVATTGALLEWTAHLMSKSWLGHTDWDDLIRDAAAGTGPRLRVLAERAA